MSQELKLTALKNFKCIAEKCPDTCCKNWNIEVDQETYKLWKTISDDKDREKILSSISIEQRNGSEVKRLKKKADNYCVHLNNLGLCSLQLKYGAKYIPNACQTYPRLHLEGNQKKISSAVLSCPEIARLVLFQNGEQPLFELKDINQIGNNEKENLIHKQISDFLINIIYKIFNHKDFSLNIKLHFLAKMLVKIVLLGQKGNININELERLADHYKDELTQLNLAYKQGEIQSDPHALGSYWYSIYRLGDKYLSAEDNNPFMDNPLIQLLDSNLNSKEDKYKRICYEIQSHRLKAQSHTHIYESAFTNYLIVSFINKGFPWNPIANNYIAAFLYAISCFSMMQLMLWIKVNKKNSLTSEDITEAVYLAERSIGHSDCFYQNLNNNPALLRLDLFYDCLLDIY